MRGRSPDSRIIALPSAFPDVSPVAYGRGLPGHRFGPSAGLAPASQILPSRGTSRMLPPHILGPSDQRPRPVAGTDTRRPLAAPGGAARSHDRIGAVGMPTAMEGQR
jgi:hypothetical protein